ncbi:cell wall galactomannoprotein [Panaeolus papilionaceus]|nr:cell wall galactomannoprotein [Panaeolus papilionaceus]
MKLSFSFILLSSLLRALATTPEQVLSDIKTLTSKADALDNSIKAFKSPTDLTSAWNIHFAARSLLSDIDAATRSAVTSQPVPPSYVPDALSLCEGLQDSIVAALRDAAAQKGTVAAMPIPGTTSTVRKDLEDLKTESEAFQQALLAGVDNYCAQSV